MMEHVADIAARVIDGMPNGPRWAKIRRGKTGAQIEFADADGVRYRAELPDDAEQNESERERQVRRAIKRAEAA